MHPQTAASREAMSEAKLPLAYRDSCAHLLIPLNKCRPKEWYLPWKCEVGVEFTLLTCVQLSGPRMSDIPTRNASMKSSRSGLRRWTSSRRTRNTRGVIERCQCHVWLELLYIYTMAFLDVHTVRPVCTRQLSQRNMSSLRKALKLWKIKDFFSGAVCSADNAKC